MKQIPNYKEVPKQQADGMGWAFDTKDSEPRPYYFKFPELKPKQVRIRVLYTSICHTDVAMTRMGYFGDSQPVIPGHQVVGKIESLGSQTKMRKVGQLVGVGYIKNSCNACQTCNEGFDQMCPKHPNITTMYPDVGGFSTHIQVQQDWAFLVGNLNGAKVAPLFCAGITMYNALQKHCCKGNKVGIVGIGGLGHLGILLGSRMGMEITGFSRTDQKEKEAKELGAKHFVVTTDENMKKQSGKQNTMIITADVSDKMTNYIRATRMGGKICVPAVSKPFEVEFADLTPAQREIVGIRLGSKAQYQRMINLCQQHQIQAICQEYDFMDFAKAFQRAESGKARYRVVMKVTEQLLKK